MNELFFEKAMCVGNPFMEQLIDDYLDFRNRKKINPYKAKFQLSSYLFGDAETFLMRDLEKLIF